MHVDLADRPPGQPESFPGNSQETTLQHSDRAQSGLRLTMHSKDIEINRAAATAALSLLWSFVS